MDKVESNCYMSHFVRFVLKQIALFDEGGLCAEKN